MNDYAFPVELERAYLKSGLEVPKIRMVVRQDTGVPIATVSDQYKLVKHDFVMSSAEKFINLFGEPERKYHVGRNGARVVGEFTFKNRQHLRTVQKGDIVGLRVYVENSYNTESSVRVQVGAIVLSCLNGMVVPKSIFSHTYRHVLKEPDIVFPDAGLVLDTYQKQTGVWQTYAERELAEDDLDYPSILTTAVAMDVITQGGRDRMRDIQTNTYWDLMQNFTFEATHRGNISPIGRLSRLERSDRFIRGIASSRRLPIVEAVGTEV